MPDVLIVEACHTAVGKFGEAPRPLQAEGLSLAVLKCATKRNGIDPKEIYEVIMGPYRQCSDCANIARVCALSVGILESFPANTVMCTFASVMLPASNDANSTWWAKTKSPVEC